MAREFIDGFESGKTDLWDSQSDFAVATGIHNAKDGTYYATGENPYAVKNLPASSEKYFAVRWGAYANSANDGKIGTLFSVYGGSGANLIGSLRRNASNVLEVVIGGSVVATGTASILFAGGAAYSVEMRYKVSTDAGVGKVQVKVNGVTDIDFTGVTQPGADATIDAVRLGKAASGDTLGYFVGAGTGGIFDNFIADNANWIGDTRIKKLQVGGAGTSAQWTPSSGANYTTVDEIPAVDTDYNASNTNDQLDTFATTDPTGITGSIKCVQIQARCGKEGTPTLNNLKLALRTNSTDYVSANKAVTAAYTAPTSLFNIWETNPNTSSEWSIDDLNALEIGYKAAT